MTKANLNDKLKKCFADRYLGNNDLNDPDDIADIFEETSEEADIVEDLKEELEEYLPDFAFEIDFENKRVVIPNSVMELDKQGLATLLEFNLENTSREDIDEMIKVAQEVMTVDLKTLLKDNIQEIDSEFELTDRGIEIPFTVDENSHTAEVDCQAVGDCYNAIVIYLDILDWADRIIEATDKD
jgi:hypothetical protein